MSLLLGLSASICLLPACTNQNKSAPQVTASSNKPFARQTALAKKLYKKGEYKHSFDILKPLAEQGNPNAQYYIGYMYYYGQGIKQNKSLGVAWIKKSAKQGYEKARRANKVLYTQRKKTKNLLAKKQNNKAVASKQSLPKQKKNSHSNKKLTFKKQPSKQVHTNNHLTKAQRADFKKAIEKAIEKAKKYYSNKEYAQTFTTLKPLAEKGDSEAQYSLGYLYLYGEGVKKDEKRAIFWINKAANQGFADAINARKILAPKNHQINLAQTPHKNDKTHQFSNNAALKQQHTANNQTKQYGPIQAEETLWAIAKKTRPNTAISIHQMMQALYKNNPRAFNNKKLNSLKLGSTLSIPNELSIKEILSHSTKHN